MEEKIEKYAALFELIEKAGGAKLKNIKALTFSERMKVTFNPFAFLFTIIYYVYTGMWKKGVALFGICIVINLIGFLIINGFESFSWVVTSVIFATRANVDLYKEYKLQDKSFFSI